MKIHIPIEEAVQKTTHRARVSAVQMIPVVAVALFVGFLLGRGILLPKTDPRMQVGAVLESTQKTDEEGGSLAKNNESDLPKVVLGELSENNTEETAEGAQNTIAQVPAQLPLPESLLRTEELDLSITDRETAIMQLSGEIERIKNDSVALVSMFNSNCGNWKDECAKPYAAALEINNSTHNELITKVTKLLRELDQFRTEKIARR